MPRLQLLLATVFYLLGFPCYLWLSSWATWQHAHTISLPSAIREQCTYFLLLLLGSHVTVRHAHVHQLLMEPHSWKHLIWHYLCDVASESRDLHCTSSSINCTRNLGWQGETVVAMRPSRGASTPAWYVAKLHSRCVLSRQHRYQSS